MTGWRRLAAVRLVRSCAVKLRDRALARITLRRDLIELPPVDGCENYTTGRLRAAICGVPVPARLAVLLLRCGLGWSTFPRVDYRGAARPR